jgi:hypothetical protein
VEGIPVEQQDKKKLVGNRKAWDVPIIKRSENVEHD